MNRIAFVVFVLLFCMPFMYLSGSSTVLRVQDSQVTLVELPQESNSVRTAPPVNVQAQTTTSGQIKISWDPYPASTGFMRVYQSTIPAPIGSPSWSLLGGIGVAHTEYLLAPGTGGYFYVTYDTAGEMSDRFVYVEGGTTAGITVGSFWIDKYELTPGGVGGAGTAPWNYINWFSVINYCNFRSISEGLTPCYSYLSYGTNPNNWPPSCNDDSGDSYNYSCNFTANGYRMPTMNEWRFAAMGGVNSLGFTYSGSNNIYEVAWFTNNSGNSVHGVGLLASNELGIYDMSGNVHEWVWEGGGRRYCLGGSCYDFNNYCTVWSVNDMYAIDGYVQHGVRICRTSY